MQDVDHDSGQEHGPGLVPWQPLRPAPAPLPPAHVIPYPQGVPRSVAPLFPTLPDADHRPGQHNINEQTSALRRTLAATLAGCAIAALGGLGALLALYMGADDSIVLLAFLGALVAAVGVAVAVWLVELEHSPGANTRRALDQQHIERMTAINRQFDVIERLMGVERD